MSSHRKKIIYGVVLGVAVIAFAVDRLLGPGPGPEPAEAASAPNRPVPKGKVGATPASALPAGLKEAVTEDPVIQTLHKLPEVTQVRDLFARQDQFTRRGGKPGEPGADQPVAERVEAFVSTHHLQATFRDGPDIVAVVDRALVRLGQCIDGFCLVKVDAFQAVFRHEEAEAILKMTPDAKGPEISRSSQSPKTAPAN